MGFNAGMLGGEAGGSGKLRALEANKRNTLSQSKAAKKRRGVNGQIGVNGASTGVGSGGSSGATNGLASSVVFRQNQGLQLVDPFKKRNVDDANQKWFGSSSGFTSKIPR
jgi:hypothetical protein